MTKWQFEPLSAALIEQEPTQRDQFNNDEVLLSEALVREAIQNSFDAREDESVPVKVRFAIIDLDKTGTAQLGSYVETLQPHLEECGFDATPLEEASARVLLVEDFNTVGLTGSLDTDDGQNFHSFWRRHGISGKSGRLGGRWGLGKLVYSSTSEVRAFFGLTIRTGEKAPYLLGQAVLKNHKLGGVKHPPHGFWFKDRGPDDIQMPINDAEFIAAFCETTGCQRGSDSGLSIVIPYPNRDIDEAAMLRAVVKHYYFPILAGALVVEVGGTTVSSANITDVAAMFGGLDLPIEFASAVQTQRSSPPQAVGINAIGTSGLTESDFASETLTKLRSDFQNGAMIHVEVPVRLSSKAEGQIDTHIRLFLQLPTIPNDSCALFIRGSLTVPGEGKKNFHNVPAYGALVAADPQIEAFLGDAENPAHTSWDAHTEKLTASWRNPYNSLRAIRSALKSLYQLVAEEAEQEDHDALIDFFSLVDHSPSGGTKRKRTPKKVDPIQPREIFLNVQPRSGGFVIAPGAGAASRTYPVRLRVRLAYDMLGADPFKRFSPFDFDLKKNIELELENADAEFPVANVAVVTLQSPDFRIAASGFDVNRDLLVEARAT
jgi:hypothetical protein